MSMDLFGEVAGRIGFEGGNGEVADVKVKTSSDYASVVNPEDKTAYIDLSEYTKRNELSEYVTSEALETTLDDYTTYEYTESRYTPLATFNNYTIVAEQEFQKRLTAGENITIDPVTNTISASGGGGGLDLPTDGTPVAIGTFGNKSIYMQYINVNVHTGATNFDVWTGQSGDYVLGYNMYIHSPNNQGVVIGIPNNDSYCDTSYVTNINTVIPTIKLYINIKQGFLSDVMCVGYVLFVR